MIRKLRRQMRPFTDKVDAFVSAMAGIGEAASKAAESLDQLAAALEPTTPEDIPSQDDAEGGALALSQVGVPYPTQSGGQAVKTAVSTVDRVNAAAAELGLDLAPWQRDLAARTIDAAESGQIFTVTGGRRAGRTTTRAVIHQALRGPDSHPGWPDELYELESPRD